MSLMKACDAGDPESPESRLAMLAGRPSLTMV